MTSRPQPVDDLTVTVAGQGGDGSLTLVHLLSELLGSRGLHLYETRAVASRIKGGHAAASLRASLDPRGCLRRESQILVAFDSEAVQQDAGRLGPDGIVVYDSSDGPLPPEHFNGEVIEVPLGRLAVRDMRRDLYKNSFAFGILSRLLGVPVDEAEQALRRRLRGLVSGLLEANVGTLHQGAEFAEHETLLGDGPRFRLPAGRPRRRLMLSGNEAVALGFLAAGGRFFAGYPITPASEILELLAMRLPESGGVAVQAEDELAAINMAIGAALTGVRAMTATSGPGLALMQEGVSHLASAEIGVVVVDCQRAGPSTGMPTKPEQSDLEMMMLGASGDVLPLVLVPADPGDAFELTVLAANLAEIYQGPVYVALDQVVAQDATTVEPFDLGNVAIERGARLSAADVARSAEYRRYLLTEDGISPWVPVGTPGAPHLVTGNERDEWGRVSIDPDNRTRMVEKRARKLATIRPLLPAGRRWGKGGEVGILGFGMEVAVMREAAELLRAAGVEVDLFQVRTLSPILEDTLDFIRSHRRVFVVEHNAVGQYARALRAGGAPPETVVGLLRYDGRAHTPEDLAEQILQQAPVPV